MCVCVCVCVLCCSRIVAQEAAAALGWSTAKLARQLDALVQQALLEHCVALRIKNPSTVLPPPDWLRDALAPHLQALTQ